MFEIIVTYTNGKQSLLMSRDRTSWTSKTAHKLHDSFLIQHGGAGAQITSAIVRPC